MTRLLVDTIISGHLTTGCSRLLAADGITTLDFSIVKIPRLMEGLSVNAREIKRAIPEMAAAMSIAKNLDEYDYRICQHVKSIPDSEAKLELQKYRIGVAASFSKLIQLLKQGDHDGLLKWSKLAGNLLETASESLLKFTSNPKMHVAPGRVREALEFFGLSEEEVTSSLRSLYGMS